MAHRPELLLLDEPAGGLDPAARREFLEASITYLNETGSTIVFSSHHMPDVERIAGRIVMLHDGTVLLDDTLDDLREEFSLALIPKTDGLTPEKVREVEGCISARSRFDAIHAILRTSPAECETQLHAALGTSTIRCTSIPLEEMFVELMGGSQ
jgi:ABC-2 type transport system ATP-binding protein